MNEGLHTSPPLIHMLWTWRSNFSNGTLQLLTGQTGSSLRIVLMDVASNNALSCDRTCLSRTVSNVVMLISV